MSLAKDIERYRTHPEATFSELDKLESEESLLGFITRAWSVLEPETPFVSGWCIEALCDHLEAVSRGELTRLLINVPPGATKSMTSNVFWPAWEWGPRAMPHLRYISASYEQGLSVDHMRRCRETIESDWYQSKWPTEFKADQNQKTLYANSRTGWRKASSVASSLVGYRGDRVIVDDPHDVKKVESDTVRQEVLRWFSETIPTRLNNLDLSAIIVIMQRVHAQDVSGLIIAKELGYEHLCLPMEYEPITRCFTSVPRKDGTEPELVVRVLDEAEPLPVYEEGEEGAELLYPQDRREEEGELLWPERFSAKAVETLKKAFRAWGGTYAEAGQLAQRPAPREGGMLKRAWFKFVDVDELPKSFSKRCRGWDLGVSTTKRSPYTVGTKLAIDDGDVYILDVVRERMEAHSMYELLRTTAVADGRQVEQSLPQDPGQAGKDQKRHLAKLFPGYDVHFSPESGSKVDRAQPFAAQAEAGNVYILRGAWNDTFLGEAGLFPNGEFLDQIDATSRAYMRLIAKKPRRVGRGVRRIRSAQ